LSAPIAARGIIKSVCISTERGVAKRPVAEAQIVENSGILGDAHAGSWHRQISLLGLDSVRKMQAAGADVGPGDFGENIDVEGINLPSLPVGTMLRLGDQVLVEVTQIGKECHDHCAIYELVGDCVMPREGIFVRVLKGGIIRPGDEIVVVKDDESGDTGSQRSGGAG